MIEGNAALAEFLDDLRTRVAVEEHVVDEIAELFGEPTGELRVLKLYLLASTRIERHIKVKAAANPFDPTYTEYFAKRQCFAWRVL